MSEGSADARPHRKLRRMHCKCNLCHRRNGLTPPTQKVKIKEARRHGVATHLFP